MTATTETQILESLRELKVGQAQLLQGQIETNLHLKELNGTVASLKEHSIRHEDELRLHREALEEHGRQLAVVTALTDEYSRRQNNTVAELKQESNWLRDHLWQITTGVLGLTLLADVISNIIK